MPEEVARVRGVDADVVIDVGDNACATGTVRARERLAPTRTDCQRKLLEWYDRIDGTDAEVEGRRRRGVGRRRRRRRRDDGRDILSR